jgi:two-component system response regulator
MIDPTKTILLVEDHPDDVELTRRALRKHKIESVLVSARNGAEALDYLFATGAFAGRDARDAPQLILLDLKLPKVDGFEVLRRIRADPRTAYVPVVVLTSSTEERDLVASYDLGANSYVRKPIDFQEFSEAVRQLSLYWLGINEPVRFVPAGTP